MLTVLFSTAAIAFFMLTLRKLQIKNYLWAGVALAFVPVIYINSTNALDYMWALSFLMMGLYFIASNNYWIAGIFIGLAVGCRITSGAMLIPYAYLTWHLSLPSQKAQNIFRLVLGTIIISVLIFLPVINVYGTTFFQYYEHFPIPAFVKNFYKGTFAVWGTLGFVALIAAALFSIRKNNLITAYSHHPKIIYTCLIVTLIYIIAFIKLPLKAAFMIPLVPFVIIIFAIILSQRQFKFFSIAIIITSFLFGINLSDPYRAAAASTLSFQTTFSNQSISFDLLQGPVIADYLKRKQQMAYADEVIQKASTIRNKTLIIAGWWMANILVQQEGKTNPLVFYHHYLPENELKFYRHQGYVIYYLPQQDEFNDLRFGNTFTRQYGRLLNI